MAEEDDISAEELEALYNTIDAEIAERGLPSDEELRREIERLNKGRITSLVPRFSWEAEYEEEADEEAACP